MKLKYEFETVDMDGEAVAVPVGEGSEDFRSMIRMNETAATILELLKEDVTEEQIVAVLMEKYDDQEARIRSSLSDYLEKLREMGVLA